MSNPFIFDIIYQPRQTFLLCLAELVGFRWLNGVSTNLEQAVIAFDKATVKSKIRETNTKHVQEIMKNVP